jgi:hypothetical protein
MFENNNPQLPLTPSLRRNILCSDGGKLNLVSLQGGDGQEKQTSLWIINDGACVFDALLNERNSSFFIPTLEKVEKEKQNSKYVLTFIGRLLLPCNLTYRLVITSTPPSSSPHNFTRFVNEKKAIGSVDASSIENADYEEEVIIAVVYGKLGEEKVSNSYIVKNKEVKPASQTEEDPLAQGGLTPDDSTETHLTVLLSLAGVLLVGAGVGVVMVVLRSRRLSHQLEEERKKGKNGWFKDLGMDMGVQKDIWSVDPSETGMGVYSTVKEEEEKDEGNSPSSTALLHFPHRPVLKETETPQEKKATDQPEKEKNSPHPSEEEKEREREKERIVERAGMLSTTSLTFLVDGLSSEAPYEKEIVDARDSLMNSVMSGNSDEMDEDRVWEGGRVSAKLAELCDYILRKGEEFQVFLIGLSPLGVVKGPCDVLIIVKNPELIQKDENGVGRDTFVMEICRWKSPEILFKEIERENEKSCVFTIGMIAFTVVMRLKPFDGDSDKAAMNRILGGERPSIVEMEERKCELTGVMKDCWCHLPSDRLSLAELKRRGANIHMNCEGEGDREGEDESEEREEVDVEEKGAEEKVDNNENDKDDDDEFFYGDLED